ncbi:uncharacterized protein PITG_01000 [Phytophthora infestans T30-4]|uniref:Uncharacterized protein n=2 Tax=Phytophthora infestans TaxID=4787 RepID=D0MS75_PHYIT|nr:uncharacterized protein PITG_01000 [Phytophthora infestans T30-4]EEY58344.1 conserved hypothetical protein [Phytophthora infestans T30-4]KAF4147777.1 hypothetical protein GN958_ATG03132 [Phytophthora infestans]KAF4150027.1 hypothetical protein GN958_ATG00820 [Phytophthora infestans]|eukprot:XP_002909530.1 conserved hypothetical protein [Phytophthora infestans T30-4]
MSLPMPQELQVLLTVKVGKPYTNCRTPYGAPIVFEFMPTDGLAVLHARISNQLAEDVTWDADAPILIKPSANISQVNYVALPSSQDEFSNSIDRLWKQAARRKHGQADFQLELYIYVQRRNTNLGIRRATEARVEASAAAIREVLEREGSSSTYGPAAQRYWAISHARQPEGTPIEPPTSASFAQLQRIDAMHSDISATLDSNGSSPSHQFVRVACRLNGGIIHLELDVAELRRAVGMPSYDLFPPFRPDLEAIGPTENVSDTDHAEQAGE